MIHFPISDVSMLNFKKNFVAEFFFFFYLTGNADKTLFVNPEHPGDVVVPEGVVGPTAQTGHTGPSTETTSDHKFKLFSSKLNINENKMTV